MLAAQRFVILAAFNNDAVLDKNTGLVWEKSPDTAITSWVGARRSCINKNVGGQQGWRLPAIAELASLTDPSVALPPILPPGHPFLNVQSEVYWSASTIAGSPTVAWDVDSFNGDSSFHNLSQYRHPHLYLVRARSDARECVLSIRSFERSGHSDLDIWGRMGA